MELKRAFEILGIPESADVKQMEDRYFLLLRRQKSRQQSDSPTDPEDEHHFDEVTQAYKLLKEHYVKLAMESNPLYKAEMMKSDRRRKIEHFVSYYKWHCIGVIAAITVVVLLINTIVNKEKEVPFEAFVMMVGDYYYTDQTGPLEASLTALVPEWQRVKVIVNFTPNETSGSYDPAYMQRSLVLLATERPDIYIVDDHQFSRIGSQSIFLPLDPYEDSLKQRLPEELLLYHRFGEDTEAHLYGIDMSQSTVSQGYISDKVRKIFTIRRDNQDPEAALHLLLAIIDDMKQAP